MIKKLVVLLVTIFICLPRPGSCQPFLHLYPLDYLNAHARTSDFTSGIRYIKLETNKNCPLNYLAKIFFTPKGMIIQDQHIYFFSPEGKFLRRFGSTGKGPGEYSMTLDVLFDEKNQTVEIKTASNKILVFNLDGTFLKEIKGLEGFSFGKNSEKEYLFWNHYSPIINMENAQAGTSLCVLADEKGKVIADLSDQFDHFGYFVAPSSSGNISSYHDTVLFVPDRTTTVYQLSGHSLKPRYDLDFSAKDLPAKYKNTRKFDGETFENVSPDYVTQMFEFFESKELIAFIFFFRKEPYYFIYNKNTGHSISFNKRLLMNDLDFLPIGVLNGVVGDTLITYIQAMDFLSILDDKLKSLPEPEQLIFKDKHKELWDIYKKTTINDNPVLVLYKINL